MTLTKILPNEDVILIDSLGNDRRIVDAARVSYKADGKGKESDIRLLRYLLKHKHTTPFEHVRFTFRVDLPLFLARQWTRHRTGTFSEVSGRYTKSDLRFYLPERLRTQSEKAKQCSGEVFATKLGLDNITKAYKEAEKQYEILLEMGCARELARMVLPSGLYTSFYWTTDLHNLMHFLRLRLDSHAQPEIQMYAQRLLELIEPIVPMTIEIFKESLNGEEV